ncbi:MAG: methyltransferase domain-containing protein [Candidatus Pelagibacterales bacterium]|nr:MAG: methyltransferase domain-containing protein [Pelagibacterales bacterium]
MKNQNLKHCRICFSNKLTSYLDLGKQPFSNSFLKYKDLKNEKKFPLKVVLCKNCGLSQLSIIPNTKFIFSKYDYLSSSSKALSDHYEKLVKKLVKKYNVFSTNTVLDIGCNDGILLNHYPTTFRNVVGVEPSDASRYIKQKRIKLIKSFFSYKTSKKYLQKYAKPKIITITNVLAQIDNLNEFAKGLSNITNNKSLIVIEFPYLTHMINKALFDLIYHEHLSYFSLTPLKFLFEKFDIKIVNFEKLNIGASGPAIRLFLAKKKSIYKPSKKVAKQINFEKNWGVKKIKKYNFFRNETKEKIKKIKEIVYSKYNKGFRIGCYTASSKGNTLLNCLNLKKKIILFASENNKKKIGKYTPGSHIKIISDESFNNKKIDYAILLSWNYKNFFLSKTQFIKRGGKFIIPLPKPHIK